MKLNIFTIRFYTNQPTSPVVPYIYGRIIKTYKADARAYVVTLNALHESEEYGYIYKTVKNHVYTPIIADNHSITYMAVGSPSLKPIHAMKRLSERGEPPITNQRIRAVRQCHTRQRGSIRPVYRPFNFIVD